MASKRKQDDKHLKLLREMVSKEHNKTCFECNQRGPTYVDMTIAAFVCTSCSGILRGINPPHRVKSISMASYTAQEIEFLQKNGNEVCRTVWLGLYDSKSQPGPESKEDGRVRDYLVQKYEKKRWYVEPSQAAVLAAAAKAKEAESAERKSAGSTHSTPEPKPLKMLIGNNAASLKVSQPPGHTSSTQPGSRPPTLAQTASKQKSVDLLADLGADPFASTAPPAAQVSGFGQAPFGQPAQQAPFGQPAQQAPFGQPAQQAPFGQPAQQAAFGGFADFSQAFGGSAQSSGAFMPAPQPQTSQVAQPAASSNNFGAFESAFTPSPVPIPASSAGVNQTAQGLQGLTLANSTPPAAGRGAPGRGDKYAAFAGLDDLGSRSINWSGGSAGGSSTGVSSTGVINWGSGGAGSGGLVAKSASSSGFDWGTGMPKSTGQALPGSSSLSATSFGTTTTSSATAFGSVPFGTGAASTTQGNPFMTMSSSGATPATSTMATNPFLGGGAPATSMGGPAQPNGLFGMQGMQSTTPGMPTQNPMLMGGAGGAAFGQMPQQPGIGGGTNMQMNGRVGPGFPQGQMGGAGGFGMQPAGMPNQYGLQTSMAAPTQPQPARGGNMGFGGVGMATIAGLQFGKMGQPQPATGGAGLGAFGQVGMQQQPVPQTQQFGSWGAAPNAVPQQNAMAPNPFMGSGFGQAPIQPKSNTSNPFL